MSFFYAKSTNGFYNSELNGDKIPEGSVEITQGEWSTLMDGQAKGLIISSDEKGNPILTNPPEVTKEQYIIEAERKKNELLEFAANKKSPLQDAIDLDEATKEEVAELNLWKRYSIALNRVDLSKAPEVEWPVPPF